LPRQPSTGIRPDRKQSRNVRRRPVDGTIHRAWRTTATDRIVPIRRRRGWAGDRQIAVVAVIDLRLGPKCCGPWTTDACPTRCFITRRPSIREREREPDIQAKVKSRTRKQSLRICSSYLVLIAKFRSLDYFLYTEHKIIIVR